MTNKNNGFGIYLQNHIEDIYKKIFGSDFKKEVFETLNFNKIKYQTMNDKFAMDSINRYLAENKDTSDPTKSLPITLEYATQILSDERASFEDSEYFWNVRHLFQPKDLGELAGLIIASGGSNAIIETVLKEGEDKKTFLEPWKVYESIISSAFEYDSQSPKNFPGFEMLISNWFKLPGSKLVNLEHKRKIAKFLIDNLK